MSRKPAKGLSSFHIFSLILAVGVLGVFVFKDKISSRCANTLSCKQSFEFQIGNEEQAVFEGETFSPPKIDISQIDSETHVLGVETSTQEKRIEVDLGTQTLRAYEGE